MTTSERIKTFMSHLDAVSVTVGTLIALHAVVAVLILATSVA